jgi:hypothetical protein
MQALAQSVHDTEVRHNKTPVTARLHLCTLGSGRHSPPCPTPNISIKPIYDFDCFRSGSLPLVCAPLETCTASGYTDIKGAGKKTDLCEFMLCVLTFTNWFVSCPRFIALTTSSRWSIQLVAVIAVVLYSIVTLLWVGGQIPIDWILKEATCDSCKIERYILTRHL